MDKKAIALAFSIPLLTIIYNYILGKNASDGWMAIAYGIGIFIGLIAAVAVTITLFFIRKKSLNWWQALLISFGSIVVAFLVLALWGFLMQFMAPAPQAYVPPGEITAIPKP